MIYPVLAVKDVDASVKFYTEKLGFKLDFNFAGPDGKNMMASLTLAKGTSLMVSADPALEHRGQGVVLMIYPPDDQDLDAYYADVQKRGATIDEPIKDEYWGDRTFSLRDPDGYYLTFAKTTQQIAPDELQKLVAEQS